MDCYKSQYLISRVAEGLQSDLAFRLAYSRFLSIFHLFNDRFDPVDEILSLEIAEELIDHPLVEVQGKLFHCCLEKQILCQGQVGVQVVNQVIDLVRHEEGVSWTLQDELGGLAVKLPGPEKLPKYFCQGSVTASHLLFLKGLLVDWRIVPKYLF